MSTCNYCGRYTTNTKFGEDCKFCKEVYAQGVADGQRLREEEIKEHQRLQVDGARYTESLRNRIEELRSSCDHHALVIASLTIERDKLKEKLALANIEISELLCVINNQDS